MERTSKKAEKFLKILLEEDFNEVYESGDFEDFDLKEKYAKYNPEYDELIKKGYVIHPTIPLPDKEGNIFFSRADSLVTTLGKAYLEELSRNIGSNIGKAVAWIITTTIAVAGLVISIIALVK